MTMFILTMVSDATGRTSKLGQGTLFGTRETEKAMGIKKLEEVRRRYQREGISEMKDLGKLRGKASLGAVENCFSSHPLG